MLVESQKKNDKFIHWHRIMNGSLLRGDPVVFYQQFQVDWKVVWISLLAFFLLDDIEIVRLAFG